jgi:hypothetical protein
MPHQLCGELDGSTRVQITGPSWREKSTSTGVQGLKLATLRIVGVRSDNGGGETWFLDLHGCTVETEPHARRAGVGERVIVVYWGIIKMRM